LVIIITGALGVGKTEVCRKLIEVVRRQGHACSGVLTYKSADESLVIEDVQTGKRETLASINDIYHGPRTPKYFFNPAGITLGLRAIDNAASSTIMLVDELGHLELRGEGFAQVLELVWTGKSKTYVLVIRSELLPRFLPKLPLKYLTFEVTISNRDKLPKEIGSVLLQELR